MRTYITIGCAYIITGCVIAVLAFYESYCARSSRSPENPEWHTLLSKSIKFAGAIFLLLVVFTVSQILCKHFHIGFWISFIISVLVSLGFLEFCHRFNMDNLFSIDESTTKKTTEKKNKELPEVQRNRHELHRL